MNGNIRRSALIGLVAVAQALVLAEANAGAGVNPCSQLPRSSDAGDVAALLSCIEGHVARLEERIRILESNSATSASVDVVRSQAASNLEAFRTNEFVPIVKHVESLNGTAVRWGSNVELFWPVTGQCIFAHGTARSGAITTDTCGAPTAHHQFQIRPK